MAKFKPEFKYGINEWIIVPLNYVLHGSGQKYDIVQIKHYNIYNRNNIRYVVKSKHGYFELDKIYVEKEAVKGNRKVMEILYGQR